MCDVVSEKANKKPGTGVCVCACPGVDRVLGWKKFSNQCPGFLPECFSNASTQETQERLMKQIWFWLFMDKLKWCTSVLCTTFPFQRRLKAGHAANLIQSGQNHIELQHLGMWSEKYWPYIFEFLLWVASVWCTEALFQAFNPGWSPSEDVWKNTSWLRAQKKCVLSAAASAKSTHHSNRCRQGAGQCSSWDNGETSCWCFQQANSSSPELKASRHLVSEAVSSQTWLCLYAGSLEMMHNIFHQIPNATTKASNPSCILSCAT